jgi:hypothetical protein
MLHGATDGRLVVARFLDGRVLKGTTHDFAPNKPVFHLSEHGDLSARGEKISVDSLKAVFFVKSYEGDSRHDEKKDFEGAAGQGRRVVVTFTDGETLAGFTTTFSPGKQGWFLIPVDTESNNARVYVVTAAVRRVEWADRPAAAAARP